jgi:Asp/Glu/hydantoin racemase
MPRIWHQSLTDLELLPQYRGQLEAHFAEVAPAGTMVDVHGVRRGTYPARYPGTRISQVYLQSLHREQFVAAALEAEAQGYDGMIIATIPDLGLEECRSIVDIPVVGFGQSSFHAASFLGDSIGVVSFTAENLEPQLARTSARYGFAGRLGPVVSIDASFDQIVDALAGDGTAVLSAFRDACGVAADAGATVIVPGAGPLNLLVARSGVTRVREIPIVDSLLCAVEFCSTLARMRARGIYVTRRGFYWRKPEREEIQAARAVYGL